MRRFENVRRPQRGGVQGRSWSTCPRPPRSHCEPGGRARRDADLLKVLLPRSGLEVDAALIGAGRKEADLPPAASPLSRRIGASLRSTGSAHRAYHSWPGRCCRDTRWCWCRSALRGLAPRPSGRGVAAGARAAGGLARLSRNLVSRNGARSAYAGQAGWGRRQATRHPEGCSTAAFGLGCFGRRAALSGSAGRMATMKVAGSVIAMDVTAISRRRSQPTACRSSPRRNLSWVVPMRLGRQ